MSGILRCPVQILPATVPASTPLSVQNICKPMRLTYEEVVWRMVEPLLVSVSHLSHRLLVVPDVSNLGGFID
jgi:hypothetical protein